MAKLDSLQEVMGVKSLFKFVFRILVVAVVAAVVASIVAREKLKTMSDDEINEYLSSKLSGRVGDDQLETIQKSVVAGVRGKKAAIDDYIDEDDDASDGSSDDGGDEETDGSTEEETAAE